MCQRSDFEGVSGLDHEHPRPRTSHGDRRRQLNAIELAATMRGLGHQVVFFSPEGELIETVRASGIEHIRAPDEGVLPSWRNSRALTRIVRDRDIDVVHAYEGEAALTVAFGPHLRLGCPMITTVFSMDVPRFIPDHTPLIVGDSGALAGQQSLRRHVYLMEPPIDLDLNQAASVDPVEVETYRSSEVIIGVVCRLTSQLEKAQGVMCAIDVVDKLAENRNIGLLIVGQGPDYEVITQKAKQVNHRHARNVVVTTGGLMDPRPAYEACDILLGMGSSALKALAFAKPLVVQGARGFWQLFDEDSVGAFLEEGFYGSDGRGPSDLRSALLPLLNDDNRRSQLGQWGHSIVQERFSLSAASRRLESLYVSSVRNPPGRAYALARLAASARETAKFKVSIGLQRAKQSTSTSSLVKPGKS